MGSTVRISSRSDQIIDELVEETGKSKIVIIDEALECYRFKERMRLLDEQYEKLRSDPNAWKQEEEERKELDGTLNDGLEEF
jgi:predicted DNA-binding protein